MRDRKLVFLLSLLALFIVACSDSNSDFTADPPAPAPQVATIQLTQPLLRAVPQEVTQQRFSGFDSQGAILYGPFIRDKAASIELQSVPITVTRLQIEYLQGETVVGLGSVAVNLVFGETFEVTNPPFQDVVSALSSLQVTPGGATIADGSAQQYTVIGTFADNTQADLTSSATWTSSNTAVATIAPGGLATAEDPGDTTITANIGPVSNSTTLTVSAASITSIDVTPNAPSIVDGTNQQFVATANLSDGSTQDVTTSATWASSAVGVATVGANTGLAEAQNTGQTTISATVGSVTGSTVLNVSNATVTSLVISPGNQTIAEGTTQQFTVTANFTSGPSQDVTSSATWTSSGPGTASITSPGGLATAVSTGGPVTIEASFGGETASTNLTVSAAEIASIEVTPTNPAIADGTNQQFTATATLTDNSTQDVTNSASWTSGTTATATIQTSGNTNPGLASAVDPGQSTITAAVGPISGSTVLTVSQASVQSIEVTPANPTVANGGAQQFTAVATFSDTSTQDVTSSAQWSSGTVGVATITNPGGRASVVADAGTSEISASFGGETGSTTLTASGATLESITITPSPVVLSEGESQDFTATGNFSDGSNSDITDSVTWGSDDTNVVTIVATGANAGRASTAGVGNTEVTATSGLVTGSAPIVVTSATLQSIAVDPPDALSAPGSTRQYRAIGNYSDGSTRDLTSQVTWSSNNSDVLISNDSFGPNNTGQARIERTIAVGTTITISADLGVFSSTSTLQTGRFLYTANLLANRIGIFRIEGDGTLTRLPAFNSSSLGSRPSSASVHPSGRFLYVTFSNSGTIGAFAIAADGSISSLGTPISTSGNGPDRVTFHPNGRSLYVSNAAIGANNGDNIAPFAIQDDGSLTALRTRVAGGRVRDVVVEPTGRFAYTVNGNFDRVTALNIESDGGVTILGSQVDTGATSVAGAAHPNGRFLYVTNENTDNVSVIAIASDGSITRIQNRGTGVRPADIAVDPSGTFAFVTKLDDNDVSVFRIGEDGRLNPLGTTGVGNLPVAVTVDPSGRFVYVADSLNQDIRVFSLGLDGSLTQLERENTGDARTLSTTP